MANGAVLAVGRSRARPGQVSLSPGSVRRAHDLRRLVLPSPNGSTISAGLAREVPAVVAVSLRNRRAVARWLLDRCAATTCAWPSSAPASAGPTAPCGPPSRTCGAPAPSSTLLVAGGWRDVAPEAAAAAAAFRAVQDDVGAALRACASGRELIDAGYPDDVEIAAELDRSASVPVLRDGAFRV